MFISILILIIGLIVLILGADFFVKGSSQIASLFRISPLVIGLTVVAYGTSAPELGVSLNAALSQKPDMAVSNVVGSNIFNILAILGISALVAPLSIKSQVLRFDLPIMLIASFALPLLAFNGNIGQLEGFLLFSAALSYTIYSIKKSRKESSSLPQEKTTDNKKLLKHICFLAGGLIGLIFGSKWTVEAASLIAQHIGVSERIIGLTIVSAGTSFPELFTSIMATYRNEKDIAIGNVIGSNIFNIFSILGTSSLICPGGLLVSPEILKLDMIIMCLAAIICLPIFLTGRVISRKEGILFCFLYIGYIYYII